MIEKFAVSEATNPNEGFVDDLRAYVDAGCGGVGILERKLPEGEENTLLWEFIQSGLVATVAVPVVSSILPIPHLGGPDDIEERVESICLGLRRLAPFAPFAAGCLTGPVGSLSEGEARRNVVRALRKIARIAANVTPAGVVIGLEPVHPSLEQEWSFLTSISETVDLIDEVDEPNVEVVLDTWHMGHSPDLLQEIRRYATRIICVQVADRHEQPSGSADRLLPGDGVLDFVSILRTLDEAGYRRWYELEVWSDHGAYHDDHDYPLWKLSPVELARRGRERFLELCQAAVGVAPASG